MHLSTVNSTNSAQQSTDGGPRPSESNPVESGVPSLLTTIFSLFRSQPSPPESPQLTQRQLEILEILGNREMTTKEVMDEHRRRNHLGEIDVFTVAGAWEHGANSGYLKSLESRELVTSREITEGVSEEEEELLISGEYRVWRRTENGTRVWTNAHNLGSAIGGATENMAPA